MNRPFSISLLSLLGLTLIASGLAHAAGGTEPYFPLSSAESLVEEVKAEPFPQFDDIPLVLQSICFEYLDIGELESIQQIKPKLNHIIQILLKKEGYQTQYESRFDKDYEELRLLLKKANNQRYAIDPGDLNSRPFFKDSLGVIHGIKYYQAQDHFLSYLNLHRLLRFYISFKEKNPKTLSPELNLYRHYEQIVEQHHAETISEHMITVMHYNGMTRNWNFYCDDCNDCTISTVCCPFITLKWCWDFIDQCGLKCCIFFKKSKIYFLKNKILATEQAIDSLPHPHPLDFLFENPKTFPTPKTIQGPPQYQSDPSLDEKKLPADPVNEPNEYERALKSIKLLNTDRRFRKVIKTLRVVDAIHLHYGAAMNPTARTPLLESTHSITGSSSPF